MAGPLSTAMNTLTEQINQLAPVNMPPMPEWSVLVKELESGPLDASQHAFFKAVQKWLDQESNRYRVSAPLTAPQSVEDQPSVEKPEEIAEQSVTEVAPPVVTHELYQSLQSCSTYSEAALKPLSDFLLANESNDIVIPSGSSAEQALMRIWATELEWMHTNLQLYGPLGAQTLQKLTQALETFAKGNYSDVTTLFKSVQNSDKQNRTLSFLYSQFLYFRAHQGSANLLHEARQEAKLACVYADNFNPQKLIYYRFQSTLSELPFDKNRVLEQLRAYYLLNPEALLSDDGFEANEAIHFASWVLLSMIDTKLWDEFEFTSLVEVVSRVECGVPMYLALFRRQLANLRNSRGPFRETLMNLDQLVAKSYHIYAYFVSQLAPYKELRGRPWFTETRFLQIFCTPELPKFTEVMLYSSLDARRSDSEASPSEMLRSAGLSRTHYWHVWAQAITPFDELRNNRAIPISNVKSWQPLHDTLEQMLAELTSAENERIDSEQWTQAEALLPQWEMTQLVSIGEGSNITIANYAPPAQPYQTYFYGWVRLAGSARKHAELISSFASQGAFGGPRQVQLAFAGVNALLDDPNYGPKQLLKKAWNQLQGVAKKSSGTGNAAKQVGLMLLLLPLAGLTFFLMVSSANVGSAMALFGLMLALVIAGGLVVLSLNKK